MKLKYLIVETCGNVASNPTLVALVDALVAREDRVDLLVPQGSVDLQDEFSRWATHVEVREHVKELVPKPPESGLRRVAKTARRVAKAVRTGSVSSTLSREQSMAHQYACILGVDPLGIVCAHRLNEIAGRPMVYISFELLLSYELESDDERSLKQSERDAISACELFLLQDPERAVVFCKDNDIAMDQCVLVPVAPADRHPEKTRYLHERLGIPESQRLLLFQGSLSSWSGRDEFEEIVGYLPEGVSLVVHSRFALGARMRRYIDQLASRGSVYLSDKPVPLDELPTLTASADIGFATYRPGPEHWTHGDNLRHIGLASGKIAFYAMCGLPILARQMDSLRQIVDRHDTGRLYDRLADIPRHIEDILADHGRFSTASRSFYENHLDPETPVGAFCDRLLELAHLEAGIR